VAGCSANFRAPSAASSSRAATPRASSRAAIPRASSPARTAADERDAALLDYLFGSDR